MHFSNAVLAYNKQKDMLGYLALGAIANIAFNVLLIPRFGIVGSAIATLIAQLIYVSLTWRLVKKINNFLTFPYLKKILTAAIVMAGVSFALKVLGVNVILNISLAALVYLGILFLLREELLKEVYLIFNN